jgi:Protein of unknown function (DUF2924)
MTVSQEVAALARNSIRELQLRYAEVFGESTSARNKGWLVKRIAWRIQAQAEGDLSERAAAAGQTTGGGAGRFPPDARPGRSTAPDPGHGSDPLVQGKGLARPGPRFRFRA